MRVVAVSKHGAVTPQATIDGLGDANGQPLHAAAQRVTVVRLGQEVQVVALDREVHQPEPEAVASVSERTSDGSEHCAAAQRLDGVHDAQRDVDGMMA